MKKIIFSCFILISLVSCQKIDLSDDQQQEDGKYNITLSIGSLEQVPFESTATRAVDMKGLCSRFTVALFQGDTKVKSQNQTSDEESFGSVTFSLEPGTYQLVAIAHNGAGNCTVSSPEKITFSNNKMTDTFYYYGTLTVTEASSQSLALKRAVSMFRLNITDNMPESVSQMKFYYTGGSSTFNAVTGYGCVNSKQTETFTVSSSSYGAPSTFDVYTFPHEATDKLNLTVTALSSTGETLVEKTYSDIPIQLNYITQHSDTFFSSLTSSVSLGNTFTLDNDGQWAGTIDN